MELAVIAELVTSASVKHVVEDQHGSISAWRSSDARALVCSNEKAPAARGGLRRGSMELQNLDQDRDYHEGLGQEGPEAGGCKLDNTHFGSSSLQGR